MNVPHNMILGHLSKLCETQFFDNILRLFINNNIPNEEELKARMSEDIIVNLIYHYYSTTSLVYSQITVGHHIHVKQNCYLSKCESRYICRTYYSFRSIHKCVKVFIFFMVFYGLNWCNSRIYQ